MITASALAANCGHPRFIEIREAGPEHDRAKCAKKRDRASGLPKGCRTCGRHSPRCATEGVCVICSAPRGQAFHDAIQRWGASGWPEVADEIVRGWMDMLAMIWAPAAGDVYEIALGLSPNGLHVPVNEPQPHVYVAKNGEPLLTAGRADCLRVVDSSGLRIVHVKDWKTGGYAVTPATRNLQLSMLALSAADLFQADGFVRESYYIRDGYVDADHEPVMLDSPEAADAWSMVLLAAQLDDTPRPGPWCEPCWERRTKRCKHAQETP